MLVSVCFGLPEDAAKYEDIAGRPRNDEDPVEWEWRCGFVVSELRCLGNSCFFRGHCHCEAELKVVIKCLLPAEAIYSVAIIVFI